MRQPGGILRALLDWLGLGGPAADRHDSAVPHPHHDAGPDPDHDHDHDHTHGVVDPSIAATARGIWAIKWSFVILAATAILQLAVVFASGSVALLADTIHNFGDASTAIPLWVAFRLLRRGTTRRFTYGFGRVEDLAGVLIVLIILASALVAGWEAFTRLLAPQPLRQLPWVALAGVIGFLGNEAVAVFRIRVGRSMHSAALIADGYHARTDGLTSLAVVAGAGGVWLGFPLADPLVGLLITLAIFGIVWQSAVAVFTRLLDGVEPATTETIRHVAEHVDGVAAVGAIRARWLGHALAAQLDLAVEREVTISRGETLAHAVEAALKEHLPALESVHIRFRPPDAL